MDLHRLILISAIAFALSACSHKKEALLEKHTFTIDTMLAHTPPLNQGRTSTCWAYGITSLMESEWMKEHTGDTLRLSPMYVARQKYLNQFEAYYYSAGNEPIRNGSLGHSALRVWKEDGAMPLEAYRGCKPDAKRHDHRRLLKELRWMAEEAVRKRDLEGYRKQAERLLDEELGALPDTFLYRGKSYTPRSFADSLGLHADDYVQLTTFTHHPFYESFPLEVPDNWEHQSYLNLPLDELEQSVRRALTDGRTVVWHGDVSEATYSTRQGMAVWSSAPVTQEERQHEFEQFRTTDDHMMHIVGTAHDEAGRFYYILKNSYGRHGPFHGYIYMDENYFLMKTLSIVLHKEMPAYFLHIKE